MVKLLSTNCSSLVFSTDHSVRFFFLFQEKTRSSNQMQPSSASQLNLETAADQHRISDSASVVSFSSVAASHQNLDTKVDMVSSLLSMLGTHDKDDVARTLLAMSSSTDSCSAMRQSGCLPLLIKLLHDPEYEVKGINWEARHRAGLYDRYNICCCCLLPHQAAIVLSSV